MCLTKKNEGNAAVRCGINIGYVWLSLAFACAHVNAEKFKIVDQNGVPVSNAVLIASANPLTSLDETAQNALPTAIMDQVDKQFSPHVLVVQKGQAVGFPNSDDIRHHVYSFSTPNNFEIKLYSQTANEPVRFGSAGIVVLGCNIHDSMKGYIFVTDTEHAMVSDENGHVNMTAQNASSYAIWHSRLARGIVDPVPVLFKGLPKQGSALATIDSDGIRQIRVSLLAETADRQKKFRARFK